MKDINYLQQPQRNPKAAFGFPYQYWPEEIGNHHNMISRYQSENSFFYESSEMADANYYFNKLGFPTLSSSYFDQSKN
ncbi:hypothetical protein CTM97_21595 [Photobacterium phosphoreum]|uniref:Uncharacterized protein n=1 Tax=Photobacterium phosphoreum TaxID=659 RepID=A0A2T3JTJ0_PHOPO|nr:hypothetical protein [Photobacterium phosphoreum]PSU25862.1 hypothetical protein CTM96_07040 [Photobacterium phosphoreum]PSU35369.1 hypothetical protein CTM97_21595 [Photobacterium phosphoreum]PSU52505.1 hypothetical protein C9J18_08100 [Photobacterium phosphoreum]